MKSIAYILLSVSMILIAGQVSAQDWLVPPDKSALANPLQYNLDNIKQGKDLFTRNCQSCHGNPGKNNQLALVPVPVDIASERMHRNSDGDMFYKISTGRGVMPPFGAVLQEDEIWKLIHFIRNYRPGGTRLLVEAPPVKAKLLASVNEQESIVEVFAESNDGKGERLDGAPVIVSAKKTFGNIEIGRTVTDRNGRAVFRIPEDLIGDEEGYVGIVVSLGEGYESNPVALDRANVGKKKVVPRLIRPEVLWSTNKNVQIWLLVTYLIAALGSWIVIGYVIFQIIRIRRYSKT